MKNEVDRTKELKVDTSATYRYINEPNLRLVIVEYNHKSRFHMKMGLAFR